MTNLKCLCQDHVAYHKLYLNDCTPENLESDRLRPLENKLLTFKQVSYFQIYIPKKND